MKIRILSLVCVTGAATLLLGCTAVSVYKNTDACEQLMRTKLADTSSDTLKIAHTGAGIDGSRVVVEGSIEHVMTASEVAAAAAVAASAVHAAGGASGVRPASASTSTSASSAVAASAAQAASSTAVASLKPAKPKKTQTPAAAECTFQGPTLGMFTWLAPAKLVAPPAEATE